MCLVLGVGLGLCGGLGLRGRLGLGCGLGLGGCLGLGGASRPRRPRPRPGLRLGRGGGRLARRHLAGLLLPLHLAERDGQAAEQAAEPAGQAGDRRGDDADELPVEHVARGQLGDRLDLADLERLAVHDRRP